MEVVFNYYLLEFFGWEELVMFDGYELELVESSLAVGWKLK